MFYGCQTPKTQLTRTKKPQIASYDLKRHNALQALLVSEGQNTVADEEKPNLKTDDANFPWGIGGTKHGLSDASSTPFFSN
jgi:hypothetical protein